jgi:electron-transferring-flavoprotein dehydrogenase
VLAASPNKFASVFASGNATRDDAPDDIRIERHAPRESPKRGSGCAPAGVYEIPAGAPGPGDVDMIVNPTNCIQGGAISAKGGRLTRPRGSPRSAPSAIR